MSPGRCRAGDPHRVDYQHTRPWLWERGKPSQEPPDDNRRAGPIRSTSYANRRAAPVGDHPGPVRVVTDKGAFPRNHVFSRVMQQSLQ